MSVWPHVWRIAVIPIVPPRCRGRGQRRGAYRRRPEEQRVETRGLPWASALRSCGSVKTTWKYGIGSSSAPARRATVPWSAFDTSGSGDCDRSWTTIRTAPQRSHVSRCPPRQRCDRPRSPEGRGAGPGEPMRTPIRLAMAPYNIREFQPRAAGRPPCRRARRTRVSLCGGGRTVRADRGGAGAISVCRVSLSSAWSVLMRPCPSNR